MRRKALHLPTTVSWPLARGGIAGKSEEAVRRTQSDCEPENPEEKEIALFFVNVVTAQNKMILHLALLRGKE